MTRPRKLRLGSGLEVAYEEHGAGDPPLVLLHGLLCRRQHMAPLLAHLRQRHRVIAPDLRGHGDSSAPDGDWSMETFATDLEELIATLALDAPVVVGHSFGGSVALALAAARPQLVCAIVLLDSGVRDRRAKAADVGRAFERAAAAPADAYRRETEAWLRSSLFLPYDPPDAVDEVVSAMASMPRERRLKLSPAVLGFDAREAALACRVPALLVLSDQPSTPAAVISELPASWLVGRTVGSGHFQQLFVPDQVNAMIDRFLAMTGAGSGPGWKAGLTR